MRLGPTFRLGIVTCTLAILVAMPAEARLPTSFVEEFDNTSFRDAVNTTADWSPGAGKIQLFAFQPTLLGSFDTSGEAYDVAISGTRAYVADGFSGLEIFDVSNATPVLLGTYNTPDFALAVTISGTRAYVADRTTGLVIVDVSNPATPALLGTYNTPIDARHVAVSGNIAYVADASSGLHMVNVSNPAVPALLGIYDTPGAAEGVAVSGTRAFVADRGAGLQIINVANPAAPVLLGTYNTPGDARHVAVAGTLAYVADLNTGLQIIDVSNPAAPALVGAYDTGGLATKVAIAGTVAYVADDVSGLQLVDVSAPATPTLYRTYDTPGFASGVVVSGTSAYVADRASGLLALRIAYSAYPGALGSVVTTQAQVGVVSGRLFYVADRSAGLRIIDVSNPAAPAIVGTYNTPVSAVDVAVSGTVAYVADGSGGLAIINVSNPAAPSLLGTFALASCLGVNVQGTTAYLGGNTAGLVVVDVSNPASPIQLGIYNTPGTATAVDVSGTVAYVADGGSLQIINVANPAAPALLGSSAMVGFAEGVKVSGHLAYVADAGEGLRILNVSNPAAPTLAGTYATTDGPISLDVSGQIVCLADGASGIDVVDVSSPSFPIPIGSYPIAATTTGVAIAGARIYVSSQGTGVRILETLQNRFDSARNIVRSLPLYSGQENAVLVRVSPIQSPMVFWSISTNGGSTWVGATPDTWVPILGLGNDLVWQTTMTPLPPYQTGPGPEVSRVQLDWRYPEPVIDAVTDVGNDQGRQVRLSWTRSGYDRFGASQDVVEYAVYRRIDAGLAPNGVVQARITGDPERDAALSAGWDYVTSIPGDWDDTYSVVVPTLADSTVAVGQHWTAFRVRARLDQGGGYVESPPDSGYSLDNLAPNVPGGLAVNHVAGGRQVSWDDPVDADFRYFNVYRANDPNFVPGPATLAHSTTSTAWTDPSPSGAAVYYKLTAVDFSGNESAPAAIGTTVGVETSATPARFALHAPMPNPFRGSTALRFDVPAPGGRVRIGIYDVAGRRVRGLLDGAQAPGAGSIDWDGRDDAGRALPAGLYLGRMESPGFSQIRRLVLTR